MRRSPQDPRLTDVAAQDFTRRPSYFQALALEAMENFD